LNISPKYVSEIINHKKSLTTELIIKLSTVFGEDPSLLMEMDGRYRLRSAINDEIENEKLDIEKRVKISDTVPYHELVKKGWVCKATSANEMEKNLTNFYGVGNYSEIANTVQAISLQRTRLSALKQSTSYKKEAKENFLIAWLASAQLLSKKIVANKYDQVKAQKILDNIPSYTTDEFRGIAMFIADLKEAGIKFLMLPHLTQTYVDGAALLNISDGSRLIVYSGRHDRIDNFWFTVTHELVHIIKHLNERDYFMADSLDNLQSQEDEKEKEANAIASEKLLLNDIIRVFEEKSNRLLEKRIIECALELKIHKAIVAGMLAFHYNNNTSYKPISYHHLHLFSGKVKFLIPKEYQIMESE